MASITSQTAESTDSTANNDEITPLPITSRYVSLKTLKGLVKDAIGAADDVTMGDESAAPVKWANAIEDALYKRDDCLGKQQGETAYTVDEYTEQFGDSITTPHDTLESEERAQLLELLRDSDNHDSGNLKDEYKLPVVNGERLPVLVADEDALDDAIDLLDQMVTEDNDAGGTADDVDDDEGLPPLAEGLTHPGEYTVEELKNDYLPRIGAKTDAEIILDAEQHTDDRVTAISAIESHIETLEQEREERRSDDDNDDGASGTTDGIDEEKLAQTVATAVTEAVTEALDN